MTSAGLHIPDWITMDYISAKAGATAEAVSAWTNAPQILDSELFWIYPLC
jgi:hypothetical protein